MKWDQNTAPPQGNYVGALTNPEYATRLARLITSFVHLEDLMRNVLAVLLGGDDTSPAGYVLRAIMSPRARVDVMLKLLEKAPHNLELGPEYDALIAEFWSINKRRNAYAHGYWWTNADDGSVWLAEEDEHGLSFFAARRATTEELDAVSSRIGDLIPQISMITLPVLHERRQLRERRVRLPKPRLGRRPRPHSEER